MMQTTETTDSKARARAWPTYDRPKRWHDLKGWNKWLRTRAGWHAGWVLLALLAVPTAVTGYLMVTASPAGSLERRMKIAMAGRPDVVDDWLPGYRLSSLSGALWRDMLFVISASALLAVAVLWAGQNYRTVTARALACPLFVGAVGAGILGATGDGMLLLAVNGHTWRWWELAAVATWGAWLVTAGVVAYVAGGLLSLLLPRRVISTLQSADEPREPTPVVVEPGQRHGLAFSGGGIRAASISLGALQRFDAEGQLGWEQAGRVTAVSGGSYMAGAWSLARRFGDTTTWVDDDDGRPGPEERHLRANLGYLLSNTPRQTARDNCSLTPAPARATTASPRSDGQVPKEATAHASTDRLSRAERNPGVLATALVGLTFNLFVFLALLWTASQLAGWFYRWYFSAACPNWRTGGPLTFADHHGCLSAEGRPGWPVVMWLVVGIAAIFLWVLLGKATSVGRAADGLVRVIAQAGSPLMLVLKYVGYSALALSGVLGVLLVVFPLSLELLWRPVSANALLANTVAVVGGLSSGAAVLRLLRRPLARLAPTIGGALFALVLAYLGGLWTLSAMTAATTQRHTVLLPALLVALLLVHLCGAVELWSLAPFYRGKIRGAFATYRDRGFVRPYRNGSLPESVTDRTEPSLWQLAGQTPLTVCASATVQARGVRTHADIPALSVTFCPEHVRVYLPRQDDGDYDTFECSPRSVDVLLGGLPPDPKRPTLRARMSPRLTTMLAVGLSGAAVSPAMGRFRIGPVSMLLAFFNVRLGMWIPNPRYADVLADTGRPLPRPGLGYLLKEFVGLHDPSDLYLYVTDGGHWENTGLVELLRSRDVDEVVCVDADSGPGNLVTSVARAVDLAKLECDARIVLGLDQLRADRDPSPGRDYSPRSVNLGLVLRRDPGEAADRVTLLWYAKPALTEDMPPHLLAFREVERSFPRISTVNQFFHVAQFAAYRDLGRYNAGRILRAREVLAAQVADNDTFADYRRSLKRSHGSTALNGRRSPEQWVLRELVTLLRCSVPEEDQEAVYEQVRTVLRRSAPPAMGVPSQRAGEERDGVPTA